MGDQSAYLTLDEPVSNVNSFTDEFWSSVFGEGGYENYAKSLMGSGMSMMSSYDPTAAYKYALNNLFPQMQGLVTGGLSGYSNQQMGLARQQAADVISQTLGSYAGENGVYSGAAAKAASQGASTPYLQAISNITGAQNNLLGGMFSSAMAGLPGAFAQESNLGASLFEGGAGLLGQAMNIGGVFAAPEWMTPTYYENPDYWSSKDIMSALLGVGDIAATLATGGWSKLLTNGLKAGVTGLADTGIPMIGSWS